jgi:hypothetical protein
VDRMFPRLHIMYLGVGEREVELEGDVCAGAGGDEARLQLAVGEPRPPRVRRNQPCH